MSIIAHPLTQLDGSPQYTASDYRKSVNALLLPSDGTAFGSVQGVRAGSPSPLIAINGTTVTVKAHAGVLCPWAGVGAYTYEMDADTSVAVTDTTGTYKIALVLSDPSQSHGTTPGLALQSFPGTTPDTAIAGLVLGKIVAGVGSDIAPRILQRTMITVSTLATLTALTGVEGQQATVTSDPTAMNNTEYTYRNGSWVRPPRIYQGSKVFNPNGVSANVLSSAELVAILGHEWSQGTCSATIMNGDYGSAGISVIGTDRTDNGLNARLSASLNRNMRFSWIIVDAG